MNIRKEFPTADNSSNMNGFGQTEIASTLDALKASVAGETGASAKYAGYAEAADAAGFPQVAKLFRAASAAEQVHIGMEAALVEAEEPDYVRPTAGAADPLPVDLMLIDAANGEIHETSDMYPAFIAKAKEEGNDKAVKACMPRSTWRLTTTSTQPTTTTTTCAPSAATSTRVPKPPRCAPSAAQRKLLSRSSKPRNLFAPRACDEAPRDPQVACRLAWRFARARNQSR